MQRIEADGGLFISGNPATSTLGTVLTAEWANAIQEELVSILVAAGGVLNPGSYVQIRDSIVALIDARITTLLASSAETIAGTRDDLAVSPAGLAALTASTERRGLAEIATPAELAAGSAGVLVPTVSDLMALFSNGIAIKKLPKGIVFQTGESGSIGYDMSITLTFPEAFSAVPVVVPYIKNMSGTNDDVCVKTQSVTATQVTLRSERNADGTVSGTRYVGYIAMGTI